MTAPAAPAGDPRQNRYPVTVMCTAREMYGDGDSWTPTQIHRYFAEHLDGPTPSVRTIRKWVVPGEVELQRRLQEASQQRAKDRAGGGAPRLSTGELSERQLLERMLLLRRTGLTFNAIAKVVEVYHAVSLTEHQVRSRLQAQGVPKNAAKSAAVRRAWMENHYSRPQATAS